MKEKGDGMQDGKTVYYKAEAAKVNSWSSDEKAASCEEMPSGPAVQRGLLDKQLRLDKTAPINQVFKMRWRQSERKADGGDDSSSNNNPIESWQFRSPEQIGGA